MLKTSGNIESKAQPSEGRVGVDGDSRARYVRSEIDESGMNDVEVDGDKVEVDEVGKKVQKSSKFKILSKSKKTIRSLDFLTLRAKLAFTKLKQAFLKAPILYHFDPECHIRIETGALGYTISRVLSQLTSDDLGRWHSMAWVFCKMILAETRYKMHDGKLLAIVKAFKTWRYYLEGFQHKVLIFTNHNNLRRFMDTKSLSSKQVR